MNLQELGVTGYGEKIYRTLLVHDLLNAKELSKYSTVPPTAVYPAIQALVNQGLVLRIDGLVQQFQAVDPKRALPLLAKERTESLLRSQKEATKELELLQKQKHLVEDDVPQAPIRLSRGSLQSVEEGYALADSAKKTFFVLGWNFTKKKSALDIGRRMKKLQVRGVDVRLLFTHKTPAGDVLRSFFDQERIPYRFVKTGFISLVIADGSSCKITLKNTSLKERVNLVVDNADLAFAMQQYFLKMWTSAKKTF